eukprot:TRINITY_DN66753_c0_g1_i1.p1 TRINITY_DN66753_c0_g1~~TRINITY_DN66753_c0_g1_i1.p1  ORF type:complete len:221 (+),score=53.71 TRINITY_DN66753_c0_g1_i1:24-665(+)
MGERRAGATGEGSLTEGRRKGLAKFGVHIGPGGAAQQRLAAQERLEARAAEALAAGCPSPVAGGSSSSAARSGRAAAKVKQDKKLQSEPRRASGSEPPGLAEADSSQGGYVPSPGPSERLAALESLSAMMQRMDKQFNSACTKLEQSHAVRQEKLEIASARIEAAQQECEAHRDQLQTMLQDVMLKVGTHHAEARKEPAAPEGICAFPTQPET